MKMYETKYTFDNGMTQTNRSSSYELPEYKIGESGAINVLVNNEFKSYEATVIKIEQEMVIENGEYEWIGWSE